MSSHYFSHGRSFYTTMKRIAVKPFKLERNICGTELLSYVYSVFRAESVIYRSAPEKHHRQVFGTLIKDERFVCDSLLFAMLLCKVGVRITPSFSR